MSAAKKFPESKLRLTKSQYDSHTDEEEFHETVAKKAEEGEGPWLVSYADLMTLLMGFFALMFSMSTPDQKQFEKVREAAVTAFGGRLERPYEPLAASLKKFIDDKGLGDQIQIKTTIDGVQLTFVGTLFFDSGDYHVKTEAAEMMKNLAEVIKREPNSFRAMIEGHTDGAPIAHTIISSNWELSGLRASRIAQIFEANGFTKESLTIIGWGETKPLFPEHDQSGGAIIENMAQNRRVVVRVYDRKYSSDPIRDN